MPDQLRERFEALRNASEHSDSGGLHDVHSRRRRRRRRRTRARVGAATAAAVGALALGGVLVVPQLGTDDSTRVSNTQVLDGAGGSAADADSGEEVAAEQAPTEPSSPESEPGPAATGPFAVTGDSLLTWPEIQAVGETGPGTSPYSATLVLPGLCGAENAYAQYSQPAEVVAAAWTISDGTLTQSALQYESDLKASDALARLVADAQACPVFNEFGSITYTGSDPSVGAEIAFFELRLESGQDGSIHTAVVSVTRIANVLIEVVLNPDGPTVADADPRSRALAGAAVTKIVDTG